MIPYPNIDPVAFGLDAFTVFGKTIGPLNVHWYGIMYLCAFTAAWILGVQRSKKSFSPVKKNQIEDMVFYGALGIVIGGRCGYVLFYNFSDFLANPLSLIKIWEGGMSFHGGMLGVIFAIYLYSRKIKQKFWSVIDFVAPLVPLGLGFGRIGNFIGGELWGRQTDVPWGMVFPADPEAWVRHPSQLYQAFLEGVVFFLFLLWFSRKERPRAAVSALFLIGYGVLRFFVEFFREPDAHIGFDFAGWLTRGQILSVPMIIFGAILFYWVYIKNKQHKI